MTTATDAPATTRSWWVSWYGLGEFEYHGPWWCSGGEVGGQQRRTFVAAVRAADMGAAQQVIVEAHDADEPDIEWRFTNERDDDWDPFASDRFPRSHWMRWPWPVAAEPAGTPVPGQVGDEHVLFHVAAPDPVDGPVPPMAMSTARINDATPLAEVIDTIARSIEGAPDRLASSTTESLVNGPHYWGKKIVEEAYELGCAIEHEDDDAVALEASQLLYRLLVGVMGRGVAVRDVLAKL